MTGCKNYDTQNLLEAIYDKTRPPLFVEIEEILYEDKMILALKVDSDGEIHATSDGRCLKRLGKNSKPFYPDEMSHKISSNQTIDYSSKILIDSSLNDIDLLEVYKLKEKLKVRDSESTLPYLDDMAFLRDLELLKLDNDTEYLTVAGMLFAGKKESIQKFLPQAEVTYLHYSKDNLVEYDAREDMKLPIISVLDRLTEKISLFNKITSIQIGLFRIEIKDFSENVFQEAALNALAHRDYESLGSVYIKHYPDKIVIESPGGFIGGITEDNIITHPSVPRNKRIAETLQRLKYVQRTGQGVDIIYKDMVSSGKPFPEFHVYSDAVSLTLYSSIDDLEFVKFIVKEQDSKQKSLALSELMILRYLSQNKRIKLSEAQLLVQMSLDETRKYLLELIDFGMIELVGKEYMLTARVYEQVKSEINYVQDKTLLYIKAKGRILDYLEINDRITNEVARELCGYTKNQVRYVFDKMKNEGLVVLIGKGRGSYYELNK